MRDADDYYDDYHDYDEDQNNYIKDDYDEHGGHDYLAKDYGFQKQMEDDMEVFIPKDFFDFASHGIHDKIRKIESSEEIFMIITESNRLFRWEIESNRCYELTLPGGSGGEESSGFSLNLIGMVKNTLTVDRKGPAIIERVFLDPKGTHCLICTSRGDNYYVHQKSDRVRLLKNFRERIRSAIIDDQSTNELVKIACGTNEGKLYFFNIDVNRNYEINDNLPTLVTDRIQNQDRQPLPILHLEYFHYIQQESNISRETAHRAVFALTSEYLYFFTGSRDFGILFNKYINKDPNTYPGLPLMSSGKKNPIINFYTTKGPNQLLIGNSFVVSDGNYIHYCKLPEKVDRTDFNPFAKMQTLKYAKKELVKNVKDQLKITDPPIAIAASQHHYFILHKECLTILSTINETVVGYYEGDELSETKRAYGMILERGGENIYIYDSKSVKTISLSREGQDVWKLYLENKKYQEAYEICRRNFSSSLQYVAGLYADHLFNTGKYDLAADIYTETSRSFEEICLKYLNKDVLGHLEKYLQYWLKQTSGPKDKMRRVILLSWLLEYKLHVLNEKEREIEVMNKSDDERKTELVRAQNEFREFLNNYQRDLDENVTYSLLQTHGRFNEFVQFAENKERFEDIILHHINEEEYTKALEKMGKLQKAEQKQEMMYKHCHILMKEETKNTLDFIYNSTVDFDLTKLIPGFMKVPAENRQHVVDFLWHYCTETTHCKEKSIHNIYIFFLANLRDEDKLDEYLSKQEELLASEESGGILYDMDFALRNFQKQDLIKAQITVYGMMGLYSDAVSLALEKNMIEEAKDLASKPEGSTPEVEELKKKLWLQIAQHLIKSKQTEAVIKLTRDSENIIRIEDLLPQFDDDFKIELFKDDISASLKTYVENIKKLKSDMSAFDKNAEHLKGELRNLKNRFFEIRGDQKCEDCSRGIFTEEFYVFPCGHCYHKECLKKKMKVTNAYPEKIEEIETLDKKLTKLITDLNISQASSKSTTVAFLETFNPFLKKDSAPTGRTGSQVNAELEKQIKETRERLDFLLAGECLSCGRYLIETITLGFDLDDRVRREWEI